jgi:DNA helicase II / ATP-dependent DNA helicase PcrA
MSATRSADASNDADAWVDKAIAECLNLANPKSFFLFAGAGSGKTRSLVNALGHVQRTLTDRLRLKGQRVAVITFTNAACDEIKSRLQFDALIDVRTIHSFAWSLIEGLNRDIREWLRADLADSLKELQAQQAKSRGISAAHTTRQRKIESKTRRLQNLDGIKRFVYSPTGENRTRDALNHAEVIQIAAHFLVSKPVMQRILVGRYPILLIDESQDTNRHLIDAFFAVEEASRGSFVLGLIGDMMQRIYSDGKEGLGTNLPTTWARPEKKLNHRCPKRIIELINKVRSTQDKQQQLPRDDAPNGVVRLFILQSNTADKPAAERAIAERMAHLTGDEDWKDQRAIKTLTLEHRMAASRMGFLDVFSALYEYDSWRTSLLEGTLGISRFFTEDVLSLMKAREANDRFAVARIAKALSPLMTPEALRSADDNRKQLQTVASLIDDLAGLRADNKNPTLGDVLRFVGRTQLLTIPEALIPYAVESEGGLSGDPDTDDPSIDAESARNAAISKFLQAPFSQVQNLGLYLAGRAHFDTHQGVKGLEFDRVMVVMDDSEARGFMFKYEDLFGGKTIGDKTVESTRRLFYVTCSRAKRSLALVAYSAVPDRVRRFVLQQGWFGDDEAVVM